MNTNRPAAGFRPIDDKVVGGRASFLWIGIKKIDILRAWRRERSKTDGVPPYVVFNDATMLVIAAMRPATAGSTPPITA